MPKELEDKLKKQASKQGLSGERAGAYVYGTMRKTGWRPSREKQHGSLEDITFHEEAAQRDTVMDGTTPSHNIHKGYSGGGQKTPDSGGAIQWGADRGWHEDGDEPEGSVMSANRDNGYGVHYGAPVDYFGPDTDYRVEEIDPHQYGKDWEPFPFKDVYKTGDKQWERGFRVSAQDQYDETSTPGAVTDEQPMSEAHGAVNYQGAGPDEESGDKAGSCDYRSFESQREFARANKDKKEPYAVDITGLDTHSGEDIK